MSPKFNNNVAEKASGLPAPYRIEHSSMGEQRHHPSSSHQGLPAPVQNPQHSQHSQQPQHQAQQQQHIHQSARAAIISSHPGSPHHQSRIVQQQPQQPVSGPYASPHLPSHSLPSQHQPQYASVPSHTDVPYYAHHGPASIAGAAPSYSSAENIDANGMATAAMNQRYGNIYNTPQAASPSSVQSPHQEHHSRPMYSQQPQIYPQYSPYSLPQQSPYGQHPVQPAGPLSSNFMPHQSPNQTMSQHTSHSVGSQITGSPDTKMSPSQLMRPAPGMSPTAGNAPGPSGSANNLQHVHGAGPGVNPNAAPGPIPATTPLVVRQDQNGVQWIAFEYSRDRVKMEYTIRCDVESVDVNSLSPEFKTENCVYPRASCPKDQYKGNRLHYESECNTVGWALAQLNPSLRGKRGLIQRAVDSWRNSNQDPRLRSRRVRRMAKMNNRKQQPQAIPHGAHMTAPGGPAGHALPSAGLTAPGSRQPGMGMGGGLLHHHHDQSGGPPGGEDVSAGPDYGESHHHQAPNGQPPESPNQLRQTHNFYTTYPAHNGGMVSSTVPPSNGMSHLHNPHSAPAASTSKHEVDEEADITALYGDLPEAKRRKFILVDDVQRNARVRVRVMLDQVKMAEMPDSYRKNNSVYPRSWFATEMQSPPPTVGGAGGSKSTRRGRWPDDVADDEADRNNVETRTLVPVPILDGSEAKVSIPKMTHSKRNKEVILNDLGYRMSWSQSRVFSGRTLFLQRSLDAYRNKMRSTMVAAGQDVATVAPHFETRIGKRRWIERNKKLKRESSA